MLKIFATIILSATLTFGGVASLYQQAYDATAVLAMGYPGHQLYCSATVIDKIPEGYIFLTAAHCTAVGTTLPLFISPDSMTKGDLAERIHIGNLQKRDDWALLRVKTKHIYALAKLTDILPDVGDDIFVASFPQGFIKTILRGGMAHASVQGPPKSPWVYGTASILQLPGTQGGTSGGGAYNTEGKLFGILVGVIDKGDLAVAYDVKNIPKEFFENLE